MYCNCECNLKRQVLVCFVSLGAGFPTWARSVQTASDCLKEVRLFCFPADARLISEPALSCTAPFPVSSSFWTPRSTSSTFLSETHKHSQQQQNLFQIRRKKIRVRTVLFTVTGVQSLVVIGGNMVTGGVLWLDHLRKLRADWSWF